MYVGFLLDSYLCRVRHVHFACAMNGACAYMCMQIDTACRCTHDSYLCAVRRHVHLACADVQSTVHVPISDTMYVHANRYRMQSKCMSYCRTCLRQTEHPQCFTNAVLSNSCVKACRYSPPHGNSIFRTLEIRLRQEAHAPELSSPASRVEGRGAARLDAPEPAMCSCRSFCRWLPVLFVLALIIWCYFIFTFDILLTLLALPPSGPSPVIGSHATGVAYTVIFNIIFAVGMIAFARATFTDPGQIPASWAVGAEDTEAGPFIPQLTAIETKHDGSRRICRKSKPNMYKPDRAHFCKMLGRCVLKMDHFCPWCALSHTTAVASRRHPRGCSPPSSSANAHQAVSPPLLRRLNNCIGFANHKYFYLFIFYMAALTIFMLVVRHLATHTESRDHMSNAPRPQVRTAETLPSSAIVWRAMHARR